MMLPLGRHLQLECVAVLLHSENLGLSVGLPKTSFNV